MKWIDADKYWPTKDSENILVDGVEYITLKSIYTLPDHDEVVLDIGFFHILQHPQAWSYSEDYANKFSLDNAYIYKIDPGCCNVPEKRKGHMDFIRSLGINRYNLKDFVSETENFTSCWDTIIRWAYLNDE